MTAQSDFESNENESTGVQRDATQETNNDVDIVESKACTCARRKRKRGENSGGRTCKKSKVS